MVAEGAIEGVGYAQGGPAIGPWESNAEILRCAQDDDTDLG
jgi:hypothetical protein